MNIFDYLAFNKWYGPNPPSFGEVIDLIQNDVYLPAYDLVNSKLSTFAERLGEIDPGVIHWENRINFPFAHLYLNPNKEAAWTGYYSSSSNVDRKRSYQRVGNYVREMLPPPAFPAPPPIPIPALAQPPIPIVQPQQRKRASSLTSMSIPKTTTIYSKNISPPMTPGVVSKINKTIKSSQLQGKPNPAFSSQTLAPVINLNIPAVYNPPPILYPPSYNPFNPSLYRPSPTIPLPKLKPLPLPSPPKTKLISPTQPVIQPPILSPQLPQFNPSLYPPLPNDPFSAPKSKTKSPSPPSTSIPSTFIPTTSPKPPSPKTLAMVPYVPETVSLPPRSPRLSPRSPRLSHSPSLIDPSISPILNFPSPKYPGSISRTSPITPYNPPSPSLIEPQYYREKTESLFKSSGSSTSLEPAKEISYSSIDELEYEKKTKNITKAPAKKVVKKTNSPEKAPKKSKPSRSKLKSTPKSILQTTRLEETSTIMKKFSGFPKGYSSKKKKNIRKRKRED